MAIYTQDGKILTVGTDIATSQDCCCDVEQWRYCIDDTNAAKLDFSITAQDYAWLCLGGTWKRCYNAFGTGGTATNPSVLEQCGTTASTCDDLIGWPADDNFNGIDCASSEIDDTNHTIRWSEGFVGTCSSQITGGYYEVTANSVGNNTGAVYNNGDSEIGSSDDFIVEVDLSVITWGVTDAAHVGTKFAYGGLIILVGGTFFTLFLRRGGGIASQHVYYEAVGIESAITVSTSSNTASFKFIRSSGSIQAYYNTGGGYTTIGSNNSKSGTMTENRFQSRNRNGTSNNVVRFDNYVFNKNTDTIYIDPTGTSCT